MRNWRNVTESFSENERHYKNLYLEIDEVYDEIIEVSLFSSQEDLYEIYVSFGSMYGIIYAKVEEADSKREEVKAELVREYKKNKEPTSEFINEFAEKYKMCLPNDILFDSAGLYGF